MNFLNDKPDTTPDRDGAPLEVGPHAPPSADGRHGGPAEDVGATFAAQLAGSGETYLIPGSKKSVGGGTVAFVGLAAAAGLGLWFMHQRTGGPAEAVAGTETSAARSSIQQFLAGGARSVEEMRQLLEDTEQIKQRFLSFNDDKQVPLDELKTNPFWHDAEDADPLPPAVSESDLTRREAERRRSEQQKAENEAARIEVQTIFFGRLPTALVNNKVCREGQEVNGFVVEAIRADHVVLRRGEWTFERRMSGK